MPSAYPPAAFPARPQRVDGPADEPSTTTPDDDGTGRPAAPPVRIAAAGDMHCQPSRAAEAEAAFGRARPATIDLLLLAGDLTTHGQPEQAQVLADAVPRPRRPDLRGLGQPRLALRPRSTRSARSSRTRA